MSVNPNYFPMKQNDLKPYLQVQFFDPDNEPMDVTGKTIRFLMSKVPGTPKVNAVCIIVTAIQGIVEYRWVTGDTDTLGVFKGEFEIDAEDTYPKDGYIVVEVLEDIN